MLMFSHKRNLIIHYFFLVVHYVSSVMRSSWHISTSGFNMHFPRTPKKWRKKRGKIRLLPYFDMLLRGKLWCEIYLKMFVGPWSIYIKCLLVLLTNGYWFRATGGYICGCGRPSNLVKPNIIPTPDFILALNDEKSPLSQKTVIL